MELKKRLIVCGLLAGIGLVVTMTARAESYQYVEKEEWPEEDILEFLEENLPHLVPHLKELREEDPEAHRHELREIRHHLEAYERTREEAPEIAEAMLRAHRLEAESWELARSLTGIEDAEAREKRVDELRSLLEQIFDLRMKQPEMELRHLEDEVRKIREMVQRRHEARDRIIDRRLENLIDEADEDLEWW